MSDPPPPPPPPPVPEQPSPAPATQPLHVIVEQKGPVKVGGCFGFFIVVLFVAFVFTVCVALGTR